VIEGLVNDAQLQYNRDSLLTTLVNVNLNEIVQLPEELSSSQLSAFSRGLIKDYPAMDLSTISHRYGIGDTMLSIVCDHFETGEIPILVMQPTEHKQRFPKFRPFGSPFFNPLLEFLSIYSSRIATISNVDFSSRVKNAMQFPLNSLGRISPAFAIIYQYPDLFPYRVRSLAFQLGALDPLAGLARLMKEFAPDDSVLIPTQVGLPLVVRRDRILEEGIEILRRFAAHKIPFDFRFHGEDGHGPGVAREFFALLSQSFVTSETLWRPSRTSGLYPSPIADSQAFEDIGVLVAKALSMDCLLELPLAPAFLALVRDGDVAVVGGVKQLARALASDLTGIDFECPGYPAVFARIGETVTSANCTEFVALVTESVIGARPRACAAAFRRGFEQVLSLELLDVLTEDEIAGLIAGQPNGPEVTDFELRGYEANDSVIVALGEVLGEFNEEERRRFIRFVTGASHLPVGGAAALTPTLAIWRMEKDGIRSDDLLPTAAICANALKLPPYTSKDQLRSKLLLAMTDGKDSFFLD
jgi:hypothetical protein